MKLTEKGLQNIATDKPRDISVTDRRGLILRLEPSRGLIRKTFRLRWKRAGKQSVVRLGMYGAAFRLADAHALHALCVQAIDHGGDPRATVEQWWATHAPAPIDAASGPTVGDVVREFLDWAARERKRPEIAKALFDKNVLPWLADRPVASIRKRDLVLLFDRIVQRDAPVVANRVQALLKQAFAVAADRDLIDAIPIFPRKAPGGAEAPRTRVLSDAEVKRLWTGLDELTPTGKRGKGISRPLALALKLLLVTAQRRGEVAAARWDDIICETVKGPKGKHVKQYSWRIPETKNDRPHHVPLSPLAVELLDELRTLSGESEFWLPSATSDQAADDRDRTITKAAREVRDRLEMESWTPHDLRRTARTNFSRIGVTDAVAERVLNHVAGDRMVQVYNQHSFAAEMRVALDTWATELRRIITT